MLRDFMSLPTRLTRPGRRALSTEPSKTMARLTLLVSCLGLGVAIQLSAGLASQHRLQVRVRSGETEPYQSRGLTMTLIPIPTTPSISAYT